MKSWNWELNCCRKTWILWTYFVVSVGWRIVNIKMHYRIIFWYQCEYNTYYSNFVSFFSCFWNYISSHIIQVEGPKFVQSCCRVRSFLRLSSETLEQLVIRRDVIPLEDYNLSNIIRYLVGTAANIYGSHDY